MPDDVDLEAMVLPESIRNYLAIAATLLALDEIVRLALVDRLQHDFDLPIRVTGTDHVELALEELVERGVLEEHDVTTVRRLRGTAAAVRHELSDVRYSWIRLLDRSLFKDAYRVFAKVSAYWMTVVGRTAGLDPTEPIFDAHAVLLRRLYEAAGLL